MIRVKLNKEMTIDEVYALFETHGMLGDSYNEMGNNQIEIIDEESISNVSYTREEIEEYGADNDTEFEVMERKFFFYLESDSEGEFSWGGYVAFYGDDSVIGELDGSELDGSYNDLEENINEFCKEVGWKII